MKDAKIALYEYVTTYGRPLSNLMGSVKNDRDISHWALNKENALQFISLCLKNKVPILGGDVIVMMENGEWYYTYNNWFSEKRGSDNSIRGFVIRSCLEAHDYIESYREDENDYGSAIEQLHHRRNEFLEKKDKKKSIYYVFVIAS